MTFSGWWELLTWTGRIGWVFWFGDSLVLLVQCTIIWKKDGRILEREIRRSCSWWWLSEARIRLGGVFVKCSARSSLFAKCSACPLFQSVHSEGLIYCPVCRFNLDLKWSFIENVSGLRDAALRSSNVHRLEKSNRIRTHAGAFNRRGSALKKSQWDILHEELFRVSWRNCSEIESYLQEH